MTGFGMEKKNQTLIYDTETFQLEKEKEGLVRELVDNNKLVDLKDVVDTLVAEKL